MLRSMTGYGRATLSSSLGDFSIEIHSLNRKSLEINLNVPQELRFALEDIRTCITSRLRLGCINLFIQASFKEAQPLRVGPNLLLAQEIYAALCQIQEALKIKAPPSLDLLLSQGTALLHFETPPSQEGPYREQLKELTHLGIDALLLMCNKEGETLALDFKKRLTHLHTLMREVQSLAAAAPDVFKEKLLKRMKEQFPSLLDNEERVLRELVLYAEKSCVEEEVVRFLSHLNQFESLLEGGPEGVGKKMEFLTQEMLRELNTLGAKSASLEIINRTLEMKTELSRIREQVQNVE